MKKILLTALCIGIGAATAEVKAHNKISPADIKAVKMALEGKSFTIPRDLKAKHLQIAAECVKMKAAGMKRFAEQFKDENIKKSWIATAKHMELLSEQLAKLKVPNQKLMKKVEGLDQWMDLKARKCEVKAAMLRNLAKQVTNAKAKEILLKKAEKHEKMAMMMKGVEEESEESEAADNDSGIAILEIERVDQE